MKTEAQDGGQKRGPGKLRTRQDWLASDGCTSATATSVPPLVGELKQALAGFRVGRLRITLLLEELTGWEGGGRYGSCPLRALFAQPPVARFKRVAGADP
ncbi:MAG: hypothetical protein HS113_11305 [Verrucomicrobiales bacterium]|nr:hypothetical protein [Verrucomicrobiales bacterium]